MHLILLLRHSRHAACLGDAPSAPLASVELIALVHRRVVVAELKRAQ